VRIFITGGSGFIGSAVIPELVQAGHQVTALARSAAAARIVADAGARVMHGDLEDLETLRAGAAASEGVIHLAFIHDFANFAHSAHVDQRAIEEMGAALEGSGRPLLVAAGTLAVQVGRVATERDDVAHLDSIVAPRLAGYRMAESFAARGVRSVALRFAPSVHGDGDHGFVPRIIDIARQTGVSGYIGDGSNRWPAVHRLDAARLVRLAVESAAAGAVHVVGEEGIPIRAIAEVIGRKLSVPVVSIPSEKASEHFGFLGAFLGLDSPASNELTREMLGWTPTHPGLIEDLERGKYFQMQMA